MNFDVCASLKWVNAMATTILPAIEENSSAVVAISPTTYFLVQHKHSYSFAQHFQSLWYDSMSFNEKRADDGQT